MRPIGEYTHTATTVTRHLDAQHARQLAAHMLTCTLAHKLHTRYLQTNIGLYFGRQQKVNILKPARNLTNQVRVICVCVCVRVHWRQHSMRNVLDAACDIVCCVIGMSLSAPCAACGAIESEEHLHATHSTHSYLQYIKLHADARVSTQCHRYCA